MSKYLKNILIPGLTSALLLASILSQCPRATAETPSSRIYQAKESAFAQVAATAMRTASTLIAVAQDRRDEILRETDALSQFDQKYIEQHPQAKESEDFNASPAASLMAAGITKLRLLFGSASTPGSIEGLFYLLAPNPSFQYSLSENIEDIPLTSPSFEADDSVYLLFLISDVPADFGDYYPQASQFIASLKKASVFKKTNLFRLSDTYAGFKINMPGLKMEAPSSPATMTKLEEALMAQPRPTPSSTDIILPAETFSDVETLQKELVPASSELDLRCSAKVATLRSQMRSSYGLALLQALCE